MKLTGHTIFITGGGSGIGRGLAEALHKLGNKVIIGGRRRSQLAAVVAANPGLLAAEIDIADPASIRRVSAQLIAEHPSLNVLINNAGVMLADTAAGAVDEDTAATQLEINFLGSIRLTAALLEHLKRQPRATVIYNSSVLGFTPLAPFAVYSATKAALHSYALSQRFALRDTNVRVQELVPPWVGTGLFGSSDDPHAMPLDKFIEESVKALGTDAEEIVVEAARPNRDNAGPKEHKYVNDLNQFFSTLVPAGH
jgi:uncharacterized oxidoreductase